MTCSLEAGWEDGWKPRAFIRTPKPRMLMRENRVLLYDTRFMGLHSLMETVPVQQGPSLWFIVR